MPDVLAAVVAGVLAAQPMQLPAYLLKALRLPVHQDVFAEGGAILRAPHRWRRPVGWVLQTLTAAVIAVGYAVFFAAVDAGDHLLWWGLVGGSVHFAIGGVVVGAFGVLHPDMPAPVPAPGMFYRLYGRLDVLVFLGGHLLFGALVGMLYGALAQRM